MKKLLLILPFLALGGCVTPATQMLNNNFSEVQPKVPSTTGIWTVSIGPGISTIKLESDGTGVLCEETSGHVVLNKIKYSDNMIYVQNGMTLKVATLNKDQLEAKTTLSAFNQNMLYKADNDLKSASLKCSKEL
ncbi:hypothetical protein QFB56_14670 [Acinetobacter pittii]|uniref:J517_1871 family lipoprotein n=1 Tax=Acinetobacter pittii TaxID=48296 RepID=UPI002478141B|nr:J517_1871 family lipoprotein [Acinetobacter pittii]WGO87976.1 hypothetical protein QFB56_14670 [Acinetobacter pittii]